MQSIRIFFSKMDRAKYISHLDMTRLFQRAVRRSGIKMWYTEGFHPHLYMTFALPLSLGIESECEVVDMKLIDDFSFSEVKNRLNAALPDTVRVTEVACPQMKPNAITACEYKAVISDSEGLAEELEDFLSRNEIPALKKSKSGEKIVNIKDLIKSFAISKSGKSLVLTMKLSAGNVSSLNPQLVLSTFFEHSEHKEQTVFVVRTKIFADGSDIFC